MEEYVAVAKIESPAPDGRRLRVEFSQLADRYGHRLVIVEADGRETIALQSIELTPEEESPEHPALQSLHVQPLADRKGSLAALVGMSGTNHWSLSVEPDADVPGRLIFDAACRIKRHRPIQLATRYTTPGNENPPLLIEPIAIVGQAADPRIEIDHNAIAIVREVTPADVSPTTLRWRYNIELRQ